METNQWLKLVEYGDFPHEDGIQHVSRESALEMQKKFRSLRSRLARKFSGVPIYIGHPDDYRFANLHTDTRSYAWVQDIEARDDGIWILPKWSPVGKEIIRNAFFKFLSPRWEMKRQGDVLIPVRLISVGLTNDPNIPGEAIANQSMTPKQNTVAENFSDCEEWARFFKEHFKIDLLDANWRENLQNLAQQLHSESSEELKNTNDELRAESDRFYKLACEQEQRIKELTEQLMDMRIRLGENFINFALKKGIILPNEVDVWKEKYITNPDTTTQELLTQSRTLNTESKTQNLSRNVTSNQRVCLLDLVNQRMSESSDNYTEAWNYVKQAHPELF